MKASSGQIALATLCLLAVVLAEACASPSSATAAKKARPTDASQWTEIDLAGQYGDSRTAVYDAPRNCVWILARQRGVYASDPMTVTLTRVDISDGTVEPTPLRLPGDGYDIGSLALGAEGSVWMGWGKTLTRYVPESGTTDSWTVPAYRGIAVLYSGDDRMDSLTIDAGGEVWVARSKISAVFGFNPSTSRWDRTIGLPFVPIDWTRLVAAAPDVLLVNGVYPDTTDTSFFAVINTRTRIVKTYSIPVSRYVVTGDGSVAVEDFKGTLAFLDLSTGYERTLAANLPGSTDPAPGIEVSAGGDLWLAMDTGVFRVDTQTESVTQFVFPYVARELASPPAYIGPCPPGGACPAQAIRVPGIESVVLDGEGRVWVVTDYPGSGDPNDLPPMLPIAVLQASE